MDVVATPAASTEITERFAVGGMHCRVCPGKVEAALTAAPGVRSAHADLRTGSVTVRRDPASSSFATLHAEVAAAGYTLTEVGSGRRDRPWVRPLAFGLLAGAGLLGFYLGIITVAQGWGHAVDQMIDDRWFVGAIAAGFATQVGLFVHLRGLHARAGAGGVAASTGTSTAAMLACCAHHLADILPVIGLSGAAIFLNDYKTPLLWLGIGMNLAGIAYLLRQVRRQRRRPCATHPGGQHGEEQHHVAHA